MDARSSPLAINTYVHIMLSRPAEASASYVATAMTEKPKRVPGPDHPITIERNPARITVSVGGRVVADTRNALTLREASYPPVQYIPRKDVDMSLLETTQHSTYCPVQGRCFLLQHPQRGHEVGERDLDLRSCVPGGGGDQRVCGVLSRPGRQDRDALSALACGAVCSPRHAASFSPHVFQ